MKFHRLILLLALLFPGAVARAQFYVSGSNPGSVKWNTISTDCYKLIYPRGCDSLARVYALALEKWRTPVGASIGFRPGDGNRGKIPVILQTMDVNSNGMVVWAPKRLEIYTTPQAYDPEAMSWVDMLSIHEQRHIAQMQLGYHGKFKPLNYLFGEMVSGACAGLYPNTFFLEGDAVMAETALSRSGRGRTAAFLNWYRIAFDNGDFRNWRTWLGGSQNKYAPDHYALGYLMLSGIRYYYDCPDFSAQFFTRAAETPLDLRMRAKLTKKITGLDFSDCFDTLARKYACDWQKERQSRAPFTTASAVNENPKYYTVYQNNTFCGNLLYSTKAGLAENRRLVAISPDGQERRISSFATQTSPLSSHGDRIYWSESVPDPRWEMKSSSVIRFMDTDDCKKHTLNRSGRLFSPSVSTDGKTLAATQYSVDGKCSIALLDAVGGEIINVIPSPDSLQIIQTVWTSDGLYATGLSENGYGLYSASGKVLSCILEPQPVMIKDLFSRNGLLYFTCDRNGADELYSFHPANGELLQLTSTRYGACDFRFSENGEILWCSAETYKGKLPRKIPSDSLLYRKVSFSDYCVYPAADCLSAQDKALCPNQANREVNISQAKKYHKISNSLNIHSWAPVYFDVDNVMTASYDYIYDLASAGAILLSQNALSTLVLTAGYSCHRDPSDKSAFRHSGHLKLSYTGLYPVVEAQLHINERNARQFRTVCCAENDYMMESAKLDNPSVYSSIKVYVPLNFSRGGWNSGIIPKLSVTLSNDVYSTNCVTVNKRKTVDGKQSDVTGIIGVDGAGYNFLTTALANVRAYAVRPTPTSCIYPKWGIGMETGIYGNFSANKFISPQGYVYVYGYLPGAYTTHSVKLTAKYQKRIDADKLFGNTIINTLPRGFSGGIPSVISNGEYSGLLTADYGLPLPAGDMNIGKGLCCINRVELNPFADLCVTPSGSLCSVGGVLSCKFNSLAWISYSVTLGISTAYNCGSAFSKAPDSGRWYAGPVVSMSL